jgi:two-component system cell cycle sensor histidine kinase PleC
LKFTPDGGSVKVTANFDKENACVVLAVEDTGIGIKADDLPKIFQPFSQIESPYTKTTTGTGLGLAVTKRLVDLHGGTVKMESEWGKGSKVTVTIPIGT